jgi:predicted flap endonuclease-1-like 5' DNA nuclease
MLGAPWIIVWLAAAICGGLLIGWLLWGRTVSASRRALERAEHERRDAEEARQIAERQAPDREQTVDDLTTALSDSEQQLEAVREELDAARQRAAELETEAAGMQRTVAFAGRTADAELADLRRHTAEMRLERDDMAAEVGRLEAEAATAHADRERLRAALADAALDAERFRLAGTETPIEADVAALAARDERIRELERALAPLEDAEERHLAARGEIERLRAGLRALTAARDAERRDASARISRLEQAQVAMAAARRAHEELEIKIETLSAELAAAEERAGNAEERAAYPQPRPTGSDGAAIIARLKRRIAAQADALADKEARIAYLTGSGDAPGSDEADEPHEADDLTRIWGIGPAIAEKLRSLGIVSFGQVAELTGSKLPEVKAALGDFRDRVERDAWSAQARRILEGGPEDDEGESAPGDAEGPDDLTRIWGVGPAIARTLQELGIDSFAKIADLTEPQLGRVRDALGIFPERIEQDAWREQARRLAAERRRSP